MCNMHRGAGEMQKGKEHLDAWVRFRERTAHEHGETERGLRERIEAIVQENRDLRRAIQSGVESMPPGAIATYFETDAVREAHEQRDSAYRQRDYAMATLWRINDRHHAVSMSSTKCSCGVGPCDIPRLMADELNSLYKWEAGQVERAKDGRPHHLPVEHPQSSWARST
jgi:hypothetical protein